MYPFLWITTIWSILFAWIDKQTTYHIYKNETVLMYPILSCNTLVLVIIRLGIVQKSSSMQELKQSNFIYNICKKVLAPSITVLFDILPPPPVTAAFRYPFFSILNKPKHFNVPDRAVDLEWFFFESGSSYLYKYFLIFNSSFKGFAVSCPDQTPTQVEKETSIIDGVSAFEKGNISIFQCSEPVLRIRIRRTCMFLALLDPDSSIIEQKY